MQCTLADGTDGQIKIIINNLLWCQMQLQLPLTTFNGGSTINIDALEEV